MSGSSAQAAPLPHPLKLLARLLIASALILGVANVARRPIVEPLLPAIAQAVSWLDADFHVISVGIGSSNGNEAVQVKANLAHPVYVGAQLIYPFGSRPHTDGWYQVDLMLGGVPVYCLLLLILVVAWPAQRWSVYFVRTALVLPMMALLLFIDLPFTVLAQLWYPLHSRYQPEAFWPLLAWSRFLMGGGGFMIAALMAAMTIRLSARLTPKARGYADDVAAIP